MRKGKHVRTASEAAAQRKYYQAHREEKRARWLKNRYGLTLPAFDAMLSGQGGACAVCGSKLWGGKDGRPVVDHDHVTGEVRGILCNGCNVSIGYLREDPAIIRRLADYIERGRA